MNASVPVLCAGKHKRKVPGSLHRVRNDKLDQRVNELKERKTMYEETLGTQKNKKRIPKT